MRLPHYLAIAAAGVGVAAFALSRYGRMAHAHDLQNAGYSASDAASVAAAQTFREAMRLGLLSLSGGETASP